MMFKKQTQEIVQEVEAVRNDFKDILKDAKSVATGAALLLSLCVGFIGGVACSNAAFTAMKWGRK